MTTIKIITAARRGLSESLEAYAERVKVAPAQARGSWRLDGLLMLGCSLAGYHDGLCLIGGPVHVGPSLAEVLADDDDFDGGAL